MDIRPVESGEEWGHARRIRTCVFVDEQKCPPELEWDEHEEVSRHLLGYVDGEPVAVARWRAVAIEDVIAAKLERFAVLRDHRGRGLGRQMVAFVMEDARAAGFDTFVLHAQAHLKEFYRAFGFEQVGDEFFEAGIPHFKMIRSDRRVTPGD